MRALPPALEKFYHCWLDKIPSKCRPHFYNISLQHQTVLLLETPLSLNRYCPDTTQPLRCPTLPYIEYCRNGLLVWLKKGEQWARIARALPQTVVGAKLTTVDDLIENVYITDCVKRESDKTKKLLHSEHTPVLCDELNMLERPRLFITVGDKAWGEVQKLENTYFKGKLIRVGDSYRDQRNQITNKVTHVHGMLFADQSDKYVIPLAWHGRAGNLHDSYIKYLEEGLARIRSGKSTLPQ